MFAANMKTPPTASFGTPVDHLGWLTLLLITVLLPHQASDSHTCGLYILSSDDPIRICLQHGHNGGRLAHQCVNPELGDLVDNSRQCPNDTTLTICPTAPVAVSRCKRLIAAAHLPDGPLSWGQAQNLAFFLGIRSAKSMSLILAARMKSLSVSPPEPQRSRLSQLVWPTAFQPPSVEPEQRHAGACPTSCKCRGLVRITASDACRVGALGCPASPTECVLSSMATLL